VLPRTGGGPRGEGGNGFVSLLLLERAGGAAGGRVESSSSGTLLGVSGPWGGEGGGVNLHGAICRSALDRVNWQEHQRDPSVNGHFQGIFLLIPRAKRGLGGNFQW
jgi:hypothetical protein